MLANASQPRFGDDDGRRKGRDARVEVGEVCALRDRPARRVGAAAQDVAAVGRQGRANPHHQTAGGVRRVGEPSGALDDDVRVDGGRQCGDALLQVDEGKCGGEVEGVDGHEGS